MSRNGDMSEGGPPAAPYPYGYGTRHPGPRGQDELEELFRILWRRRTLILCCVVMITMLAVVIAHQRTPEYTATAQVLIHPRETRIVDQNAVLEPLDRDVATFETELSLIRSMLTARKVVDRLDLVADAEFNPTLRVDNDFVLSSITTQPLVWLTSQLPQEWLIATGVAEQPDDAEPLPELPPPLALQRENAAYAYLGRLRVARHGQSHILNVSFTSPDPHKAARIASATADAYVDTHAEAMRRATRQAHAWLEERVEELRQEVLDNERELARFRSENDLIGSQGSSLGDSQLADLNRQLLSTRAERAEREAKLRLAREVQTRGHGYEAVTEVLTSMVVQGLRREEASLVREEAQLALDHGERHPRLVRLRTEIDEIHNKIAAEIGNIMRNLENEVEVVRTREESLERSLDEAREVSAGTRQIEVQLRELERQADSNRALYQTYLARLSEIREQEGRIEPGVRVITDALPPGSPSTPGANRITAGGFSVSLLLGVALALLVERFDRGVRSARQLEQLLGVPCLGLVPRVKGIRGDGKLHRYLQEKPLSAYTEGVRRVFAALQLSGDGDRPRVVMVTSSLPREGKTTFAASLARAAVRTGKATLLVDLDLRRPSVHRQLERAPARGVVELLAGEATLEDAIISDPLTPELHVLPARRPTSSPSELIGSDRMRVLIDELRGRYDLIVIDTPPVLGITDTQFAAKLADKVLLVVQWERSKELSISNGLDDLKLVRADVAGAVLTQVNIKRHAKYRYGDFGQHYKEYKEYYVD